MLDAVSGVFPSGAVRRRIVRVATLYLVLVSLTLGLPGAARAALAPGESHREMELDGVTRHYRVWVPAGYDGSVPVPLVLDFHGFTSNDVQQALISGFRQVADVEGFIVIHPLGVGSSWNAGDLCCGQALQQGIDDVGFARAIVDATAAEANIDRRRVYATGLSNGGAMSHRIAGQLWPRRSPR